MADADKKIRESIDERVYPGASAHGADGGAAPPDGAPGASRSQLRARAVGAVSLGRVPDRRSLRLMWMMRMMRVRTTKWGLPTPTPTGATGQKPRLRRDADDARADDEMGSSDADPDRGDGAKASASTGGGADKADGSSGGSAVPAEGAQGQSAAHSGSSGFSGSPDGQAAGKPEAPSGSGSGSSGQQAVSPQAPATISVNVTVDSSSAGGSVSADTTVALAPSSTAYDALCATGLSVNSRNSAFGVYVAGIGGLSEFDHGGGSGWKYKVNGTFPNHSASVHVGEAAGSTRSTARSQITLRVCTSCTTVIASYGCT